MPQLPSATGTDLGLRIGILLHPGGGGAQYPFRFRPHRPRGLWRRTPGPRPPRGPMGRSKFIGTLIAFMLIIAAIFAAITSDWLGQPESDDSPTLTVASVEAAGFVIRSDAIDGQVRVLSGEFEGIRASILFHENGEVVTAAIPEAQRAAENLQLSGSRGALRAGDALVLCQPVPRCTDLVIALAEAVFGD